MASEIYKYYSNPNYISPPPIHYIPYIQYPKYIPPTHIPNILHLHTSSEYHTNALPIYSHPTQTHSKYNNVLFFE